MPSDLLKEVYTPLLEDNTSYRDPLKELEEWAKEHMKEWEWIRDYSSEHRERDVWAEAKASSYKILLAKIAEMREKT